MSKYTHLRGGKVCNCHCFNSVIEFTTYTYQATVFKKNEYDNISYVNENQPEEYEVTVTL